jgi:hypothetical protein
MRQAKRTDEWRRACAVLAYENGKRVRRRPSLLAGLVRRWR